jgi:nucleoside-diphosphate-sugar epimerase
LVNAYSISKWEQEQMMWQRYRDEGLPLTVIRPAPIYGPGSSYGHGGIILAIAHGLLPGVPSDASDYITTSVHVEDLARFSMWVADRDETIGEDYNVVDNSIISYYEFLQYIGLLTGRRVRSIPFLSLKRGLPLFKAGAELWRWLEVRFGIPRVRVYEVQSAPYASSSYWLSNRKSLEAGFEYRYADVREGLKDTIDWFRDMGWLTDREKLFVVAPDGSK